MPEAGLSFGTTLGFHLHELTGNVGYINVYIGIGPMTGGGLKTSATDICHIFITRKNPDDFVQSMLEEVKF